MGESSALIHLGSMLIPARPPGQVFAFGATIKAGLPGFKGVGPKFQGVVERLYIGQSPGSQVDFFKSSKEVPEDVPPALLDLGMEYFPGSDAWGMYSVLMYAPEEVRSFLPIGANMGLLLRLEPENRMVRVKLDWENGHEIGFKPVQPGWTWYPNTIFLTSHKV